MPLYELIVIFKALERPQLKAAIHRTGEAILQQGAVLRSIENLGYKRLPIQMKKHDAVNHHGNYIQYTLDSNFPSLAMVDDHLERDVEVVRAGLVRKHHEVTRPCRMGPCDYGEMTEEKRTRLRHWIQNNLVKL